MDSVQLSKFIESQGASSTSVLVNDLSEIDELFKNVEKSILKVEELCEIVDPDTEPFKSKYEARSLIENLTKKMEGTRVIAVMEQKQPVIVNIDWRLAALRVKLATIDWDCEEPHNCEIELSLASKYYFPELYNDIMTSTAASDDSNSFENLAEIDISPSKLPAVFGHVHIEVSVIAVDVLKCLNLLGILWAGRGNVKRSYKFLHSSEVLYNQFLVSISNHSNQSSISSINNIKSSSIDHNAGIESAYTHTCFYLAQCCGHMGNALESSKYITMTLQRQLYILSPDCKSSVFEWIKNCLGLSEYYLSQQQSYINASAILLSCEKVFDKYLLGGATSENVAKTVVDFDIYELRGQIFLKCIELDVKLMCVAFMEETRKRNSDIDNDVIWTQKNEQKAFTADTGEDEKGEMTRSFADKAVTALLDKGGNYSHFQSLPVIIPEVSMPDEITSFETARKVYLRAVGRIQATMEIFPLDGHVTNYASLLLSHSRLYHYLAIFENDLKRKFTMENRRVDMLMPLLQALSSSAYESLHKNISYELGEAFVTLHDLKLELVKSKSNIVNSSSSADSDNKLPFKRVDIQKLNEFCRLGIAMFTHFASFYSKQNSNCQTNNINDTSATSKDSNFKYLNMTLENIDSCACWVPDESKLTVDELRPFFNSHFLSARLLSKVIVTTCDDNKKISVNLIVSSLRRYEWLCSNCAKLCDILQVNCDDIFEIELKVAHDMVTLLPSKIDRMQKNLL